MVRHPFYHSYYQSCGHRDAVYVAFPVNEDAESYFGLFRATGQPPFTAEERDTLAYALRGIKWFHRQLLLSHGLLVASTPLTPVERRVLQSLMTGLAEKEIAAAQGQSYHTTHEYVSAIFRKFGVNNRCRADGAVAGVRAMKIHPLFKGFNYSHYIGNIAPAMNAPVNLYGFAIVRLHAKRIPQKQIALESGAPFSTACKIAQGYVNSAVEFRLFCDPC